MSSKSLDVFLGHKRNLPIPITLGFTAACITVQAMMLCMYNYSDFQGTLIARPPEEPHRITMPFVRDLRDTMREANERVREATKSSAHTQK